MSTYSWLMLVSELIWFCLVGLWKLTYWTFWILWMTFYLPMKWTVLLFNPGTYQRAHG
jgi:hypothetical protein